MISPSDSLVEELRARRQRELEAHAATDGDLQPSDWIVLLVKRLGKVGGEALRMSPEGMRDELLGLAALAIACIEQIDRRSAPREG